MSNRVTQINIYKQNQYQTIDFIDVFSSYYICYRATELVTGIFKSSNWHPWTILVQKFYLL